MYNEALRRRVAYTIWIAMVFAQSIYGVQNDVHLLTPQEVFDRFVSFRHGLVERVMDADTKALLHQVIEHPTVYADVIANAMEIGRNSPVDDKTYKRVGIAIGLARRTGRPDLFAQPVNRLIEQTAVQVKEYRLKIEPKMPIEDEVLRSEYQHVLALRSSAIDVLGSFVHGDAIGLCIESLSEEREYMSGADVIMLRYLERVAPLRPDIRPKLEEMCNSSDSPLKNNPQLLRVLQAMDKAAAERRIEQPREKKEQPESREDE